MEWFVHFDLNKFYASIIRAFMPWLDNTAIVVMSNNDGASICQTKEAQRLGVKMGTNVFEIKDLIERYGIETFSTNFPLIADMSRRVKGILGRFFEDLEDYSIDEVFGNEKDVPLELVKEKAHTVVEAVQRGLHLPISCGIARTKTLAKVATRFAKNYPGYNRVCAIETDQQRIIALNKTPIEDIWGIGRRHTKKLHRSGITNALEFVSSSRINEAWVRKEMTVVGLRTWLELKGQSCLDLELVTQKKKNIMVSRSFGKNVADFDTISHALTNFVFMNAYKLRAQGSKTKKIYIFLHSNPFREDLEQDFAQIELPLPVPTSSNRELSEWGRLGLKMIHKNGIYYKKVGFMTMDLTDAEAVQGNLFDTRDRAKEERIDKVWDYLIGKYGRGILLTGGQGWYDEGWHIRQEKLCPCWSTRIKDFIKTVDYPEPSNKDIIYEAVLMGSCAFIINKKNRSCH